MILISKMLKTVDLVPISLKSYYSGVTPIDFCVISPDQALSCQTPPKARVISLEGEVRVVFVNKHLYLNPEMLQPN